jgi:DNA-directed RNA polymerase subunit alpha
MSNVINIDCVESFVDNDRLHYGCFIIEPFFSGQALTVANALRRTLLSDLVGTAITAVRFNNIKHEFSPISGVREDVLEIMLNLKQVIFSSSLLKPASAYLKVDGPSIVTASKLNFPNYIKLTNPDQYIATVFESSTFEMELIIEQGKGYKIYDERKYFSQSDFFVIEGNFSPVKKVNFKIKAKSSEKYNVSESLIFEIWTNGSITPTRSLIESAKFLIQLLYPFVSFNIKGSK